MKTTLSTLAWVCLLRFERSHGYGFVHYEFEDAARQVLIELDSPARPCHWLHSGSGQAIKRVNGMMIGDKAVTASRHGFPGLCCVRVWISTLQFFAPWVHNEICEGALNDVEWWHENLSNLKTTFNKLLTKSHKLFVGNPKFSWRASLLAT